MFPSPAGAGGGDAAWRRKPPAQNTSEPAYTQSFALLATGQ
jgi:hypothetical protein